MLYTSDVSLTSGPVREDVTGVDMLLPIIESLISTSAADDIITADSG